MRIEKTDKHSRTLLVKGLGGSYPLELEVEIGYTGEGNVHKAVALDGQIVPQIVLAFNAHEALVNALLLVVALHHQPKESAVPGHEVNLDPKALEQIAAALRLAGHNVAVGPERKKFKVVSSSSNTDAFGLRGNILLAEDGQGFEVGQQAFSPSTEVILKKDLVVEVEVGPNGPVFPSEKYGETFVQRELVRAPNSVVKEVWGK